MGAENQQGLIVLLKFGHAGGVVATLQPDYFGRRAGLLGQEHEITIGSENRETVFPGIVPEFEVGSPACPTLFA